MEEAFAHRFVPAATQPAPPTLLLLHGTGGSESDLLPLGRTLAPGAAMLSPRGQVSEQGMARFFRRLAGGVFDLADLKRRTHELADFVGVAATHYGFDSRQVVAVGFSNGANIAASTLLLRPGVLAGAVLLRPMVPLVPDPLPDLTGVPVLLASGEHDPLVPVQETQRLAELLRQAGAEVTLHLSPTGHNLVPGDVKAATAWFSRLTQAH